MLDIYDLKLVIIVEEKLLLFEFSRIGVFLYGVKFVYVNESVEFFYVDECFVIMGSFMFVNNNNLMLVIICRYVLE